MNRIQELKTEIKRMDASIQMASWGKGSAEEIERTTISQEKFNKAFDDCVDFMRRKIFTSGNN
jgi:hypothetical protein